MSQSSETPPSAAVSGGGNNYIGAGEIMLFGVRLKVDPIRKSVSMNNLSEYEPLNNNLSNNNITNELIMAEDGCAVGYASADDAVPLSSNASRERKRGVPWTEEEHKLFLVGLHKVGKGDWRGISRNYVKSRTPTQVASHAQKYFLRRTNTNRRRRRSSLFDITTDSVNAMPIEEARNHQERPAQLTMLPLPVTSNNGFPVIPFPVIFSMQGGNQVENSVLIQSDKVNNSLPMLVQPIPVLPMSKSLRMMIDLNSNQQVPIEQSRLSLNLSLSSGQDHLATRDFAMPA